MFSTSHIIIHGSYLVKYLYGLLTMHKKHA
jgi:hypothetical protein